jgi:hypothetical protein
MRGWRQFDLFVVPDDELAVPDAASALYTGSYLFGQLHLNPVKVMKNAFSSLVRY